MTADAELTETVSAAKDVTIDGQSHAVAASGDWSLKGGAGTVTLTDVTLAFADGDYEEVRLGGNIVLGDDVTIDVSAVTEGVVYATGVTVSDGATPTLVVNAEYAQVRRKLITGITLGEGADITVDGLAEGLFAAVIGDALEVSSQEAKIGDVYYNSLQDAIDAANNGDVVEVIADVTLPTGGLDIVDKNITITGAIGEDGKPLYTITGKRTLTGEKDGAEIKFDESGNLLLGVSGGIKVTIDAKDLPFSANDPVDGFYVLSRGSLTDTGAYAHVPATLVSYDGENATLMIKARNLPDGGRFFAYGLTMDAE